MGENLTVEKNFFVREGFDKSRILRSTFNAIKGGVDSDDPEFAEVLFSFLSSGKSVFSSMEYGFLGYFNQTAFGHSIAFGGS